MKHNKHSSGFIAMYVAQHEQSGAPERIEFFNSDRGFGRLGIATVFREPRQLDFVDEIWVSTGNLAPTILGMMHDRTDLSIIADFRDHAHDENSLPCVFSHTLLCSTCGHNWSEELPRKVFMIPCPRCRQEVSTLPEAIVWCGPEHPALVTVWNALPENFDDRADLPGGLAMNLRSSGFVLRDQHGHRIWIQATADGLRAVFHHHCFGPTVSVDLGTLGPSINTHLD